MDHHSHTAAQVVAALGLEPHVEGGFFRETYRSPLTLDTASLGPPEAQEEPLPGQLPAEGPRPRGGEGRRALATSILYLVAEGDPSRFHRLASDEIWFYHAGARLEMVFLYEGEDEARFVYLDAAHPQVLVPAQVWVAARVVEPGGWCLAGCVVVPGFEYVDFERAASRELLARFPHARGLIEELG